MVTILTVVALVVTIFFAVLGILVLCAVYRGLREKDLVPELIPIPKRSPNKGNPLTKARKFLADRGG